MIKKFGEFNLNEAKRYPYLHTLIIFDGDNMIDSAYYFEDGNDVRDAFFELSKYADLIGDLSDIRSIDNEVIGFKCQNLKKRDYHRESHIPPIHVFFQKPKANYDSFSVIMYEFEGKEEWNSYMRFLKMKCEKSDNHNEKI